MKRKIVFLLIAGHLLFFVFSAKAEFLSPSLEKALSSLDVSQYEAFLSKTLEEDISLSVLLPKLIQGQWLIPPEEFLKRMESLFVQNFSLGISRLPFILMPAFLCSILSRFKASFTCTKTGEILEQGCFLTFCAMLMKDLLFHMKLCRETIEKTAACMEPLFPLLLTLLCTLGGTSGAAFYQPALTAAAGGMITFIKKITLQLALGHGVVTVLSHLDSHMKLNHLSDLFKKAACWTLGIGFTLFLSVTALQGIGASIADGVSIRAAKYTVDHFVPVVGGMFADTMNALVGSSLLIKNALGMTGLTVLLFILSQPLLKTFSQCVLYKLAASIMEIFSADRMAHCAQDFSGVLTLFLIIELSSGILFILLIAQLLATGNLIVMLR